MNKLSEITLINVCKEDFTGECECKLMTWKQADKYIRETSPCWADLADVLTETNEVWCRPDGVHTIHEEKALKAALFKMATYRADGKYTENDFIVMKPGHEPREILDAEPDVLCGQIASGDTYLWCLLRQERRNLLDLEAKVGNRRPEELEKLKQLLLRDEVN